MTVTEAHKSQESIWSITTLKRAFDLSHLLREHLIYHNSNESIWSIHSTKSWIACQNGGQGTCTSASHTTRHWQTKTHMHAPTHSLRSTHNIPHVTHCTFHMQYRHAHKCLPTHIRQHTHLLRTSCIENYCRAVGRCKCCPILKVLRRQLFLPSQFIWIDLHTQTGQWQTRKTSKRVLKCNMTTLWDLPAV